MASRFSTCVPVSAKHHTAVVGGGGGGGGAAAAAAVGEARYMLHPKTLLPAFAQLLVRE